MKPYLLLLLALAALTGAQPLDIDGVLANLRATAETTSDLRFLLTGELVEANGSTLALEVDIMAIPGERLARAEFIQPDAIADNFIVLDGDTVYNYLFLTNQVTIFRADDPNAFGNLLPELRPEALELNLDLEALLEGYEAAIDSYEADRYTLRFSAADGAYALAQIDAASWLPLALELYDASGNRSAHLRFEQLTRNSGLNPAEVRFIPEDAERIDER